MTETASEKRRGRIDIDAASSWHHDKAKEDREAFAFNNFAIYVEHLGWTVDDARRGDDPPDFRCSINGVPSEIEVTTAEGRVMEVLPQHHARVAEGIGGAATSSVWWADGVPPIEVMPEPFVSERNDLENEIRKRVGEKADPSYVDRAFRDPASAYVVIDASAFPFPSVAGADVRAALIGDLVSVPDPHLAGVYIVFAIAEASETLDGADWHRRHYRLRSQV